MTNLSTIPKKALLITILLTASSSLSQSASVEDVLGTWIDVEEQTPCLEENLGEGVAFLIIEKNKLGYGLATCVETNVWEDGGKVKVSAGCEGPEAGIQVVLLEIDILDKAHILVDGKYTYKRCEINVKLD